LNADGSYSYLANKNIKMAGNEVLGHLEPASGICTGR
jgi:hypothetical protein